MTQEQPYRRNEVFWACALTLATGLIAGSAHATRICLDNFTITNPSPILIPCGGKVPIIGTVNFEIEPSSFNAGNCWVAKPPRNFTAQLYDDDGFWGEELYGETVITVPAGPATGTLTFTINLTCSAEPECRDCLVNDDENKAEIFVAFWKELATRRKSVNKVARCVCDDCARRLDPEDFDAPLGGLATTELRVDAAFGDVGSFDVTLLFDEETYSAPAVSFADPDVAAHTTVVPSPGRLLLTASFPAPVSLSEGPFATLDLATAPDAPLAVTELSFDSSSRILDPDGDAIPGCFPSAMARPVPADSEPPFLDAGRIRYTPCALAGAPGAIVDAHVGTIPSYVAIEVRDPWGNVLGTVTSLADGSFVVPNTFPPPATVELRATDRAGNTNSLVVDAAAACVEDIPAASTLGLLLLALCLAIGTLIMLWRQSAVNRGAVPPTRR